MDCESHSITLKNVAKRYFQEIVVLNGVIERLCEDQFVEIEANGRLKKSAVFNKSFKCAIDLKRGENEIRLRYCNEEVMINVRHEEIDPVNYDVQSLYVIPRGHDGKFQDSSNNSPEIAVRKINLCMKLVACVMESKFIEANSARGKCFALNECQIFNSKLTLDHVRNINQFELYEAIANELIETFGSDVGRRRKFVAFISCTEFDGLSDGEDYNYVNIKAKTRANPALGSGFLALLGSGAFFSWPMNFDEIEESFTNSKKVDTKLLLDDSNYRKTYCGNFSTSLGSLIHEIGHIFDLGHTQTGIMGNDFDYVHRFFISENYTEIMPKRIVSNCQPVENIPPKNAHSSRLTKLRKSGGDYLEKYRQQKNNDMTFFEPNCMLTLMHHRWFTQEKDKSDVSIVYDEVEKTVCASEELVLVEIRELDSLLRQFWNLQTSNTREFKIPSEVDTKNAIIFAITISGCTLKSKRV